MNRFGVGDRHRVGQHVLARQCQRLGRELRVGIGVRERRRDRLQQPGIERQRLALAPRRRQIEQHGGRIVLPRIPAHERIAVVAREEPQPLARHVHQPHRRREPAQQRGHRRGRHILEHEPAFRRVRHHDPRRRECRPLRIEQPQRHRDRHRPLLRLARRRLGRLPQRQHVAPRRLVIRTLGTQLGRARLRIPREHVGEIDARRILHGGDEILDRHRVVVVALDIERHAAPESLAADPGLDHPHHFGTLGIHRRGVEIVDLEILVGPDRVRERPVILGELPGAQTAHVANALHRAAALVGGELLVAIDRQPLLQRELEPVAAGDAVAGPVVEILVRDDGFDVLVVGIGRGLGLRQDCTSY